LQYMCLIYDDEKIWQGMSEDDRNAAFGEYGAFTQSIQESGNMVAGDALQPTSTATTVRVRDGETLMTDGPFAETKEQLGSCSRLSSAGCHAEQHRPLCQCRHTVATFALAAGAALYWVSKELGHANVSTTLKHYARFLPAVDERNLKLLDEFAA
jgi:hypothetical protein